MGTQVPVYIDPLLTGASKYSCCSYAGCRLDTAKAYITLNGVRLTLCMQEHLQEIPEARGLTKAVCSSILSFVGNGKQTGMQLHAPLRILRQIPISRAMRVV